MRSLDSPFKIGAERIAPELVELDEGVGVGGGGWKGSRNKAGGPNLPTIFKPEHRNPALASPGPGIPSLLKSKIKNGFKYMHAQRQNALNCQGT